MAVVMASSTRSADDLIRYALEPKKDQRGERYVMASGTGGLLVSLAKEQMRDVRERWGKNKPGAHVQAYHVIQSFSAPEELDPTDPNDWMTAQDLGIALAEEVFAKRQVLVVTQRDGAGGCLHNHLVAASVETRTGASLNSAAVMHARLVATHEAVLERAGFEQPDALKQAFTDALDRRDRGEPSRLRRASSKDQRALIEATRHARWQAECATAKDGSTRRLEPFSLLVLKQRVDRALAARTTTDWATFVSNAEAAGVTVERVGDRSDVVSFGMKRRTPDETFRAPTASDRRRSATLGEDYGSAALEAQIARNAEAVTHAGRMTRLLLSEEDEREIEARMAPLWARFEQQRADYRDEPRARERQLEEDVTAIAGADAGSSEHLGVELRSGLPEPTAAGLRVEFEQLLHNTPPAPVSAGAEATSDELRPIIESTPDPGITQRASTPTDNMTVEPSPEAQRARSIADQRRHRLQALIIADQDSLGGESSDADHEVDL